MITTSIPRIDRYNKFQLPDARPVAADAASLLTPYISAARFRARQYDACKSLSGKVKFHRLNIKYNSNDLMNFVRHIPT